MSFTCQFCQQLCTDREEADLLLEWWSCKTCNTSYRIHYSGKIHEINMDINIRGLVYSLQMSFESNDSRIVMYPGKPDDTLVVVITFPYILKGVTPDNLHDKIKTYINFS